jgi:hypothetical protein
VKIGSTLEHEMDKELQKQKLEQLWDFLKHKKSFLNANKIKLVNAKVVSKLFHHHWTKWTYCIVNIGSNGQEEVSL